MCSRPGRGQLGTMEMDKMGRDRTRTRCNKSNLLSHIEMWKDCDTNLQILQIFCDKTFTVRGWNFFAQFELEF